MSLLKKGCSVAEPSFKLNIYKRAITVSEISHVTFKKGVFGLKPSLNHKMIFKRAITVKEKRRVTFKKGVFGLKVTSGF